MQLALFLYLTLGLFYGVYVTIWGRGRWFMFPFNILGGPIMFLIIIYKVLTKRKFYL